MQALIVFLAIMFSTVVWANRAEILTSGEKLYSQSNEELIIRHFFDDRRDGVFVDVGSFHWKKYSTTYSRHIKRAMDRATKRIIRRAK